MKVTNVSVKLSPQSGDRLKAFCTMTLDGEFVVRDLKIIDGTNGLFVAMPSRKLTDHCLKCGAKNHLRAKFCNECGAPLPENRVSDEDAQGKLHADIAHPINSECRTRLQNVILDAYREELSRAGRDTEEETAVAEAETAVAEAETAVAEAETAVAEPEAETTQPAEPVAEPEPLPAEPAPEEPPPAEPAPEEPPPAEPAPEEPTPGTEEKPPDAESEGKGHIFGEGIL